MINRNTNKYDYYHKFPQCNRPPLDLEINPGFPFDKAIAEHNLDVHAHPSLLELIKQSSGQYLCKATIADRNAIVEESRSIGLTVYVYQTDKVYRLEDGIEDENWQELNVNSKRTIKIGRYNPPASPEDGMTYFDFGSERLRVFLVDKWIDIPNHSDLEQIKLDLKAELESAFDQKFDSSLEDLHLTVDEQITTAKEEIKNEVTEAVDEQITTAKEEIKNEVVETVDDMLEDAENKWLEL